MPITDFIKVNESRWAAVYTEEDSDQSSENSEFDAFHESLYLKIDSLITAYMHDPLLYSRLLIPASAFADTPNPLSDANWPIYREIIHFPACCRLLP